MVRAVGQLALQALPPQRLEPEQQRLEPEQQRATPRLPEPAMQQQAWRPQTESPPECLWSSPAWPLASAPQALPQEPALAPRPQLPEPEPPWLALEAALPLHRLPRQPLSGLEFLLKYPRWKAFYLPW